MKLIPIAFLAAASLAVSSARANHISFRGYFRFGGPVYCAPAVPVYCPPVYYAPRPVYVEPAAPVYCPTPITQYPTTYVAPASGYWRDESFNVWIPARWVTSYDAFGYAQTYEVPGHYEARTRRVWVNTPCN